MEGCLSTLRRSDVVGLPAFGQEDGRPAGRVSDLLFSGRGERVIGLLLQGGTWWRRRLIPFEEVAAIGPAAVMLRRPVVLAARDGLPMRRLRRPHAQWLGLRVLTPDGRDLGIVEDVCFEPGAGGAVTGYLVSRGLVADVVEGKGFLPLHRVRRGVRADPDAEPALIARDDGADGPILLVPPV